METWAWLLAYLLGFALLQLYLYRYFLKSTTTESPERTTPVPEGGRGAVDATENAPDGDVVACASCGAYNENHATFTFCRECGERLT
jgi:hypothetical protein